MVCGTCHSYSSHLFSRLREEDIVGMTMTPTFCDEYVAACDGQIAFPTYGEEDYCQKHVGSEDEFWVYPYEEREYIHSWQ